MFFLSSLLRLFEVQIFTANTEALCRPLNQIDAVTFEPIVFDQILDTTVVRLKSRDTYRIVERDVIVGDDVAPRHVSRKVVNVTY